jgi:hypothetical protein
MISRNWATNGHTGARLLELPSEPPIDSRSREVGENPRRGYFSGRFPNCMKFLLALNDRWGYHSLWRESQSKIVCRKVLTVLNS